MNYASPEMPLSAALDVVSLNYQGEGIRDAAEFEGTQRIRKPPQYPAFHARFPHKAIVSSETASALSSRGVYLFPVTPDNSAPVRDGRGGDSAAHQVSAYELPAILPRMSHNATSTAAIALIVTGPRRQYAPR